MGDAARRTPPSPDRREARDADGMTEPNDYIEAAHQIIIALGLPRGSAERTVGAMPAGAAESHAGQGMEGRRKSAGGNHADHGLGAGALRQGIRAEHPRDVPPADHAPVLRRRHFPLQPGQAGPPGEQPKAVYQISRPRWSSSAPSAPRLGGRADSLSWPGETLVARYAKEREQNRIPVEIAPGKEITLQSRRA